MIACGFDTNASKIATLVMAGIFILALFWARREILLVIPSLLIICKLIKFPCRVWVLILSFVGLILACWFIKESVALRFFVLFMGVMSCMYVIWDIIDDTISRKVNSSDATVFARQCGCCPSQGKWLYTALVRHPNVFSVWGVIWLIVACIYFALGIIVGLVAFKVTITSSISISHAYVSSSFRNLALSNRKIVGISYQHQGIDDRHGQWTTYEVMSDFEQ